MKPSAILDDAKSILDDTIQLRRRIHRHPELGLSLPRTQEAVLEALGGLGLEVRTGQRTTSVVARLTGARPGPTILLRGDMDALPMPEETGLPFASQVSGRHARVRARRAHGDARRRRAPPGPPPRVARRLGAVHVPARRGGLPRRPRHDRGGAARWRRGPHGRLRAARDPSPDRRRHRGVPRTRHGLRRYAPDRGAGQGGTCLGAARLPRPDPHRVRDRAGVPDAGDPPGSRLRPGGGDGDEDRGGDHAQRDPRHRAPARHHPHRLRGDPRARPRGRPPGGRGHRGRAWRRGGRRADPRLSGDRERHRLCRLRARHRARAARAGGGAHHGPSDHGERGLLLRAPARARRHREPEHAPRRWPRLPESLAPHARQRVGAGRGDRHARRRGPALPGAGKPC